MPPEQSRPLLTTLDISPRTPQNWIITSGNPIPNRFRYLQYAVSQIKYYVEEMWIALKEPTETTKKEEKRKETPWRMKNASLEGIFKSNAPKMEASSLPGRDAVGLYYVSRF
ncbi:hypothetical protein Trydic_g10853 [Trypoxylus dichotomus]